MELWTHDGLQADLAKHLRHGGDRLVWQNLSLDGGSSRPDVLALRRWGYDKPDLVAYEVKVSMADMRSDLTSGKWQKYQKLSSGVTFAIPSGLLSLPEIPPGCGLVVRGVTRWRHLRRPTLHSLTLPTAAWLRLINAAQTAARQFAGDERQDRYYSSDHYKRSVMDRVEAHARHVVGKRMGKDIAEYLRAPKAAREILSNARTQASAIIAAAKVETEAVEKDATALLAELAEVFGLDTGLTLWQLKREVRKRAAGLSADAEVRRLREILAKLEAAFAEVAQTVPEPPHRLRLSDNA